VSVSRLEVVEVIEDQVAKLTPEGRDLAERMELLAELAPDAAEHPDPATYSAQRAQADEVWDLPPRDQSIINRLLVLWEGLERSNVAESRGEPGKRYRNMAVTVAAGIKDRDEGQQVDPNRTPEQSISRLKDPERPRD
jgi:hypothetical protein